MIEILLNKALVAVESKDRNCFFHSDCDLKGFCNNKFACKSAERKDGKNVIYKLVDIPKVDLYEGLVSLLEIIDDGLDEWQGIEAVHCPDELQLFKTAQEKVKELIHDLEVSV